MYWYTNNSKHVGVVINYKDENQDAGHPCKILHLAEDIKAKVDGLTDVLWVKTRNFTEQQENTNKKLKIKIRDTQISEEMANMICQKFNQRDELSRCGSSESFADHMLYELYITPGFTFRQVQQNPPPSYFSWFISSFSSSKTSALGSSSMVSSKMSGEFCKLMKKDLESCKRNIMKVLQSLQMDGWCNKYRKLY